MFFVPQCRFKGSWRQAEDAPLRLFKTETHRSSATPRSHRFVGDFKFRGRKNARSGAKSRKLRFKVQLSFQTEVSPIWRNFGVPEFMEPIPLLKTRRFHFKFSCKAEGLFHFAFRYTPFKCTCTRRVPYFALIVCLRHKKQFRQHRRSGPL